MPMVDLEWEDENGEIDLNLIGGLISKEATELHGVLLPSESIDPKTRIGPEGMLQKQIDHISETIGYTERELGRTPDSSARRGLEERIDGLKETRELTTRQRILEETRFEQEEDITRLQRFKERAKENLVGILALSISVCWNNNNNRRGR